MIRLWILVSLFFSFSAFSQSILPAKPIVGKTTGSLPYLEYGFGVDRLGGAKMTYLDTNIVVKVVDSTIGNYKVQLSKDHFAYLPKSNFKKDSTITLQTYYLPNSRMYLISFRI